MQNQEKSVLRMPEDLIRDMNAHLPGNMTMEEVQKICHGRTFRALFICDDTLMNTEVSEMPDISVRASNALKRAGYLTVGDMLNEPDFPEKLGKIRNCGARSRAEIMGRLFFYQYSLVPKEMRTNYMMRILEMNGIGRDS